MSAADDEAIAAEAVPATPDAEREAIRTHLNEQMREGDEWYLVHNRWFRQWKDHVNWNNAASRAERPQAINNEELLLPLVAGSSTRKLKPYLLSDIDYDLLPRAAWKRLLKWYTGGPEIPRKVIATGLTKRKIVEVYLLTFSVLLAGGGGGDKQQQQSKEFTLSKTTKIGDFKRMACTEFGVDPLKIKIFNYFANVRHEEIDNETQTLEEAHIFENQKVLFEDEAEAAKRNTTGILGNAGAAGSSSASASSGLMARGVGVGYDRAVQVTKGHTGLVNLGNTCFMNSALQCMSNTPIFNEFFLAGQHRTDLNPDNPLGMGGKVAEEFGRLLERLWAGNATAVAPREFKHVISQFAPQFTGYAQHDSQELLAFLLDGLHEDLNRIKKKPYVEVKDHDGSRPDAEVAAEAWRTHRLRNDSIIVDLFQGQFKSTVTCPEAACGKVSITFDPFMYLSLSLPEKQDRLIRNFLVYPNGVKLPWVHLTRVPKKGTMADFKDAMARAANVDVARLIIAELYSDKFYKFYSDKDRIEDIRDGDSIFCYLMPAADGTSDAAPAPAAAADGSAAPAAAAATGTPAAPAPTVDRMTILAVNRTERQQNTYSMQAAWLPKNYPWVLTVPRALTYRQLYNLVLPYVRMFFKRKDPALWQAELAEPMDVPEEALSKLFALNLTDRSTSTGVISQLVDNDEPLQIDPARNAIAIDWDTKMFQAYVDDRRCTLAFVDDSTKQVDDHASRTVSLRQCLDQFVLPERLSADDPWYCPQCREHRQATKKFDLFKAPKVLVVHLKRFSYSKYWRDKLDTPVEFPVRGLDLADFVRGDIGPGPLPLYDLYAISNHYGGLGGGHYTAYAKNPRNGQWLEFDDSSVSPVDEAKVAKNRNAYVLFYVAREPGAAADASAATATDGAPAPGQ